MVNLIITTVTNKKHIISVFPVPDLMVWKVDGFQHPWDHQLCVCPDLEDYQLSKDIRGN